MTRSRSLRLYRACQRCRQRKLKCEPTTGPDGTKSSCRECLRADGECVLAGSRRGGDFSRFRRSQRNHISTSSCSTPNLGHVEVVGHGLTGHMNGYHEKGPDDPIYAELTNPGDALQILARLAANGPRISNHPNDSISPGPIARDSSKGAQTEDVFDSEIALESTRPPVMLSETQTLVIGVLGTDTATALLQHYTANYHPFSPLATKQVLATTDLRKAAIDEPFLLAVILTIASKEEPEYRDVHRRCWYDVKRQLLDILLASPSTLNVGSVEGLLLLAEWVPYLQLETCSYPKLSSVNLSAVEDNMAWSLIGQAVRHSYLLRLDKASFRGNIHGGPQELENRKRLAWIFVYIADRQISVRMGQSFWSRGPSLSSYFTARDFPTLRLGDVEHNYAFVLQASMELTQLLHNVHDILYSSNERRMHMVLRGDYNRYLDDFRHSISVWQSRWDQLKTSPKLNCTLRILKEYVRLYASAFSFQSILSRAFHDNRIAGATASSWPKKPPSIFPQGIMASPDGAYAFEAVDAARTILVIVSQADPVTQIRHMPFRFYVYIIYSAVFLYKADFFGTFSRTERTDITDLVQQITKVLEEAAASDSHIGSRYAKLLTQMWLPGGNKPDAQNNNVNGPSVHSENPPPIFNRLDNEVYDIAPDVRIPETMNVLTPDFNLFNQDSSSLGPELFDLGAGSFGFPM